MSNASDETPSPASDLHADFAWLADAPLFIDKVYTADLYDAIVRPTTQRVETEVTLSEQTRREITGRLAGGTKFDLSKLPDWLSFLKWGFEASAEATAKGVSDQNRSSRITFREVQTPLRQLQELTVHYLATTPERIFLVNNITDTTWLDPEMILQTPRALVLINLPSLAEAQAHGQISTRLVPAAAEFGDGTTVLLYDRMNALDGRHPPSYPEEHHYETSKAWMEARREYWRWFSENFSPTKAMVEIEDAGKHHGRMQWIAFRLPLDEKGNSLHLSISARGQYETGVFGYNFVKRGFKHGLRIVGTLKSEPDLNVVAIYEK